MTRGAFLIAVAAVTAVAAVSCDSRKVYDQYAHTPLSGWEKSEVLTYNVPPVPETGTYETRVGLRLSARYPFTALTLVVEQQVLPADTVIGRTLQCRLTDERGRFTGTGVNCYQYSFHVADIRLQRGDSVCIRVRHDMKREILKGISDVGMTLAAE